MRPLSLSALALCAALAAGPAFASEDAGAMCDMLAGNPDDTDLDGVGVGYDDLDADAALSFCRDAVAEHPKERRYLFELARALRKKEDYAAAIPLYEKAAAMGSSIAYVGIGLLYEYGDGVDLDYGKAADYYRKAMAAGSVVAIGDLAALYDYGHLPDGGAAEALKLYEQQVAAGDAGGMVDAGFLYQWGRGTAKDVKKAESLFRQAIANADPEVSVLGKNGLAWLVATNSGDLAEAERLAAEASTYDPDDAAYRDTLAWVKHRLGRDAEAAVDAEKAIELAPNDAGYLNRLGDIYAALGDKEKARSAWQKALAAPPPNAADEPDWDATAIEKKLATLGN